MPDNGQAQKQSNAVSGSSGAPVDNLQASITESMWRLKIHDNQEGVDGSLNHYPDRPGEPDCIYYLRTGLCGYGSNCRFNHPTHIRQGTQYRGELPERVGQPDCQYFLKTGTCKFGATCKYHHPRDRHEGGQVPLNILGLPMRQEEKPCTYYMRTGACKFGIACKFHHPQPSTFEAVLPVSAASVYGSTGSSVVPPSGVPLIGGLSAWSLPRPTYMSNPRTQGLPAYMPVVLPPSHGIVPAQQGWNTYTVSNSNPYAQLGSSARAPPFPERPEQPECQYYMRTGSCKYGPSCKYHHPKERITAVNSSTIGPHGLPLRPGQAMCTFFGRYGSCNYGSACKYDHPMAGYYNYTVPSLSMLDPSALVPYQRNSQVFWDSSDQASFKTTKFQDGVNLPEAASLDMENKDNNNMPEEEEEEDPPSQATTTTNSHDHPD